MDTAIHHLFVLSLATVQPGVCYLLVGTGMVLISACPNEGYWYRYGGLMVYHKDDAITRGVLIASVFSTEAHHFKPFFIYVYLRHYCLKFPSHHFIQHCCTSYAVTRATFRFSIRASINLGNTARTPKINNI